MTLKPGTVRYRIICWLIDALCDYLDRADIFQQPQPADQPPPNPFPPDPAGTQTPGDFGLDVLRHLASATADTLTTADLYWLKCYGEAHGYETIARSAEGVIADPKHPDAHGARLFLARTLEALKDDGIAP